MSFTRAPGMTGALVYAPLAGPIEFSTGEVILILLVLTAFSLVVPALAGVAAVLVYRRRTPQADRTGRAARLEFLKWAAIAFVAQFVAGWAIGGIASLT